MKYSGEFLKEIIFPLGGIGTGSIGLCGNGHFMDWEIFNRPSKGSNNGCTHIAVKAEYEDGRSVAKVLQGDWIKDLIGKYSRSGYSGYGFGPDVSTFAGFSHFENVTFTGEFPFASLCFSDSAFPGEITLTAFNPFIPLDADNSGIPAAIFDIRITSREDGVKYTAVFSLQNPFEKSLNREIDLGGGRGVFLKNDGAAPDEIGYGDLTVCCNDKKAVVQEYWYRGSWSDGLCTFWNELSTSGITRRRYTTPGKHDTCSISSVKSADAGRDCSFRFVLSWNAPICYNYWSPCRDSDGKDITWKNYYALRFENSSKSAEYVLDNYDMLYGKSEVFRKALFTSTLDGSVIDAVSSTLSVLKSATVSRLPDGSFYGWEGLQETSGSCEGTCTHVWSYAYALCFLFPELERSLRNCEYRYNMKNSGGLIFRTKLPLGIDPGDSFPCVDGQMATVFKTYREWKISGDTEWLKSQWDNIKKVISYAWSPENPNCWDRDRDGILEGRQHHTLDMELFGPSSWLEGMYLAALKAAALMAEYLSDPIASQYRSLYEAGRKFLNSELFNGRFFTQKIDIKDKSCTERFECPDYWNAETGELKYQIGGGCEIDQMLAQWHADIIGLGDIFDREKRVTALRSMLERNYKPRLRDMTNLWRNFAINDESGVIICDYTDGGKPVIPIPYSDECMTGFEYAFAGLLISSGFYDNGIKVVKGIRDRYDGKKRNPYNEIECGSNYAQSNGELRPAADNQRVQLRYAGKNDRLQPRHRNR